MNEVELGKCKVDFERCDIQKEGETISVEPKVMEVLACLRTNVNKVVSQQSIFDDVWPKAIFNPSSVQRSIAILRKIIEEDTKAPKYIITHPKRGYSLVLPKASQYRKKQPMLLGWLLLIGVSLVLLVSGVWFTQAPLKQEFSQLRPVTSSESGEYSLTMSPVSDVAAFVRIGAPMENQIWLKDMQRGAESQITQVPANYRKLGWAKDGKAITYITRSETKDQLNYIAIDPYTLSAMEPVNLAEFPANSIESLQLHWSSDGEIFFVQSDNESRTLLRQYSISQNTTSTLKTYRGKQKLLTVALSPDDSTLALAFDIHQDKYSIELMYLDSLIEEPLAIINGGLRGLNWHPNGQSLLISNRDKLRQLFINKQIHDIAFDNFHYIRNAGYNFQGNEILMELISLDVDILSSKVTKPDQYQTLVDTQSLDFLPIYSPLEDRFAFESHRNGIKQLFVYEQGKQRLIFPNPSDEELFGFVWSSDGQNIITGSKDKLFVIDVKKVSYQEILHDHGPFYLRQWYQHENALLVSLVTEHGIKPAKFNLQSKQLEVLRDSAPDFKCAYMSLDSNDQLYFSDNKHIYTLVNQDQLKLVWQAEAGNITGFTLMKEGFVVGLEHETEFELVQVSNHQARPNSLFTTHFDQDLHFTSTSKHGEQFLFSRVKDIKQLVRLR